MTVDIGPDATGASVMRSGAQDHAAHLLKILPAAVCVCDVNGLIVAYNDRAAELWGWHPRLRDPAQRFCGAYRLYWPDGRPLPHDRSPMRDALVSGTATGGGEVVFERPDGSRLLALVDIVPLRDGQGRITGAVSCFQDVTGRRQAEDELRAGRQDLEGFLENGTVALHQIAADGTILRANQAELDLLGYAREEYVGHNVAEFHEDRTVVDGILARLSRGEKVERHPARLRAKDGSIRHVLISSSARIRDGRITGACCVTLDVTENRNAELALHESEARLRALIEALPAVVYATDETGCITYCNEAAVRLWGRRPEPGTDAWCGSWRLYRPDGTPMTRDECPMTVALKEDRAVVGVEAVIEGPDGSRTPFALYPMPLHDDTGRLAGAVNLLVDITERKRAEHVTQQLAAIVESSDDAIIGKDLDGIITTWNHGAERLFGYMAGEVIGQPVTILIPPDRHDEEPEILTRIRHGERVDHYETVRRRKDGSLVDISLTVSPIKGADGKVVGASKIARDITERRRTDQSAQRLAAIVESSDDAIISKDLDGTITTWNRGAERLFGYTAQEAIGQPITILFPPDRYGEEPEILARIRHGEHVDHYETVRRRKDGSLVDISLTVSPIRTTDGKVVGASKIARDITERKLADARLHLLAREVDHRAKNLLTVILSMVHFTRAATVGEFTAMIEGRIRAMAHAHSMLSESHWEGADLARLAAEVLAPHRHQEGSPVRIEGPGLMLAPPAAQSIAMVLHELATNAVKYGALSVLGGRVSLEWSRRADGHLLLAWTETGGPTVRAPSRRGFGTSVIERMVRGQLAGSLTFDWRPEGLACGIVIPLDAIADPGR
jgi:PAS domain S-box-containing protein